MLSNVKIWFRANFETGLRTKLINYIESMDWKRLEFHCEIKKVMEDREVW